MYGDRVTYFGKSLARDQVVEQLTASLARWPQRTYKPRAQTTQIACDPSALLCTAKGIMDFDARSLERNERSWGSATFEFHLRFQSPDGAPQIEYESGERLAGQKQSLRPAPKVYGRD
jgi:hypothetical protein